MTEKDIFEVQDRALGNYVRQKRNLAAARERVAVAAREMEEVARELRNRPTASWAGFTFKDFPWLNQEALKAILLDALEAEREAQAARQKAIELGVAIGAHE